ncbi:MAG: hypothetical protein V4469_02640 [Patescibacteria group bacterium]
MNIIVPLPKSPLPHKGRIGSREQQDWYSGLVHTATLATLDPSSEVWVITALKVDDYQSEADLYLETLLKLGVPAHQIRVFNEGYETMGQIDFIENNTLPSDPITLFVAPTHYLRVIWFTKKIKNVKVVIAWGLPRILEAVTDCIFTVLFPIADLLGQRARVKKIILRRREANKQF